MKKLLFAGVASVALIGAASAADLGRPAYKAPPPAPPPPVPVFSWTGCYVGAQVGWGWGRKDITAAASEVSESGFVEFAEGGRSRIDTSGAVFGGQVGCDYQFGGFGKGTGYGGPWNWVIGIQGMGLGTDINGFGNQPFASDFSDVVRVKTDFLASVTGRLGVTIWDPRVLFYVKGGGAWAHDRWDFSPFFFNDVHPSQSRSGWTVGVGTEWAFAPNWSAWVEWDYYDFGHKNLFNSSATFAEDGGTDTFSEAWRAKQWINTVTVGVNYRFNWFGKAPGVVARY
jgi:outer membrane immunogenic protein